MVHYEHDRFINGQWHRSVITDDELSDAIQAQAHYRKKGIEARLIRVTTTEEIIPNTKMR